MPIGAAYNLLSLLFHNYAATSATLTVNSRARLPECSSFGWLPLTSARRWFTDSSRQQRHCKRERPLANRQRGLNWLAAAAPLKPRWERRGDSPGGRCFLQQPGGPLATVAVEASGAAVVK